MKMIILILSCQKHRERQRAIEETWLNDLTEEMSAFFIEGGHRKEETVGNRIHLTCKDKYADLAVKVHSAMRMAVDRFDFDFLLKCDDDSYVCVEKMMRSDFEKHDYTGFPHDNHYARKGMYASGCGYFLSRKACEIIAATPLPEPNTKRWWYGEYGKKESFWFDKTIEDMMTGDILRENGIHLHANHDIKIDPFPTPYEKKNFFICHYLTPRMMKTVHNQKKYPILFNRIKRIILVKIGRMRRPIRKAYLMLSWMLPKSMRRKVSEADAAVSTFARRKLLW